MLTKAANFTKSVFSRSQFLFVNNDKTAKTTGVCHREGRGGCVPLRGAFDARRRVIIRVSDLVNIFITNSPPVGLPHSTPLIVPNVHSFRFKYNSCFRIIRKTADGSHLIFEDVRNAKNE